MKSKIACTAGLLSLLLAVPASARPAATCKAHGQAALTALTQERFEKVRQQLAPQAADHVSVDMLKGVWQQRISRLGDFRKLGPLEAQSIQGHSVLVAPLTFRHGKLAALVACDAQDRLTMFRLMPASALPATASSTASPSSTTAANQVAGVVSHKVNVPSRFGPLPGMLTLPDGDGPFPAVVLAAGSGPGDMDETIGPNKPFRDLAIGLARAGVATLRFDKRGHVYPGKMAGRPITIDDEETDDVLSALKVLAARKHVRAGRLFVIGLSEGAMLAPRIAQKSKDLAGIVMMAAPARPMLAVLAEQIRARGAVAKVDVSDQEQAIANERKLLAAADAAQPPEGAFMHAPQSWWWSMHQYDAVATARNLTLPMLILQGGNDIQVSPTKDFAVWKKALDGKANVTFHLYPRLTHIFMTGKGTLADYKTAGHVDQTVIDDIATWIKAQSRK